jgi:hypothetical protein
MKKLFGLFLIVSSFASAHALSGNAYDSAMLDCLDYYHSPKTEKEITACHRSVLETLNDSAEFQSRFLDCVDYYHTPVNLQKEVSCARAASR